MDKKVEELSKGMQQKAQFIGAILHNPELIVMDEPFAGLDPASALSLKDALLELAKNGKTILLSTHRMDQAERLCHSICLINHGRAVLEGDLDHIKANYGHCSVQIKYDGDAGFLHEPRLVQSLTITATMWKCGWPPAPIHRNFCGWRPPGQDWISLR